MMISIFIAFLFLSSSSFASAQETYTVALGDTLSSIAQKFYGDASRWQEIYQANVDVIGNDPNLIITGMILQIPSTPDTSTPPPSDFQKISVPTHYKIVDGDSLETIAEALYGDSNSWQVIYAANLHVIGNDSTQLIPGVMLAIPAPTNSSEVLTQSQSTLTHYTTIDGDTLQSIALEVYGDMNKWEPIYKANPMEVQDGPASVLGAGIVLLIPEISVQTKNSPLLVPTHYKIVEGDTLRSIAEMLYGSADRWQAIYAANFHRIGDDPNKIRAGTMLAIPAASFE